MSIMLDACGSIQPKRNKALKVPGSAKCKICSGLFFKNLPFNLRINLNEEVQLFGNPSMVIQKMGVERRNTNLSVLRFGL